jgi:hypothetical protein
MARDIRLASLVGLITLCLAVASQSRASIVQTTLSNWSVAPVTIGNATWTYVSSVGLNPTTVPLTFTETTSGGLVDYSLTLGNASHELNPGIYDLSYSISLSPGTTFQNDTLDVDLTGFFQAATVTKSLSSSQPPATLSPLTSVNGSSVSSAVVQGFPMLSVEDSVSLTEGCIVTITNNFGTSTVPAPTSLIVWGVLGGCFVAAGVRRSRRCCSM